MSFGREQGGKKSATSEILKITIKIKFGILIRAGSYFYLGRRPIPRCPRAGMKLAMGGFGGEDREERIHIKEARAVLFTLQSFSEELRGKSIMVRTDNMWVMWVVKKEGISGTRENLKLSRVLKEIHMWAAGNGSIIMDVSGLHQQTTSWRTHFQGGSMWEIGGWRIGCSRRQREGGVLTKLTGWRVEKTQSAKGSTHGGLALGRRQSMHSPKTGVGPTIG